MSNDNSIKKAIANSIGNGMADIKTAYKKRLENKAEAERLAQEARLAWEAKTRRAYVCVEINEVLNSSAEVFDSFEITNPRDILLAYDTSKYRSGNDTLDFSILRIRSAENSPDYHIRVFAATLNKICLDRYRSGYSPLLQPLECELREETKRYIVTVGGLNNEEQIVSPLKCGIGKYVGRFRYNPATEHYYINSRIPQTLYIGDKFQVLDRGVFEDARLDNNHIIFMPSKGGLLPAQALYMRFARITPKTI